MCSDSFCTKKKADEIAAFYTDRLFPSSTPKIAQSNYREHARERQVLGYSHGK
jgi:hypothetical protein